MGLSGIIGSVMKSLSLATPHIIAMVGIPGSGKTYFAEQFVNTFATPFISYHQLQGLSGDALTLHGTMLQILTEVTKTKHTVVFEGATNTRAERDELVKLAKQRGYSVLFVWVQTEVSMAKKRLSKEVSGADYDHYLDQFEQPQDPEPVVVISGRHTYNTQARAILKRLTADRAQQMPQRPTTKVVRPR